MDEPLQILCDELASQGKTRREIVLITAALEDPEDQLDMAEWLALHRGASRREIITEKHRLIRNRMKAQNQE